MLTKPQGTHERALRAKRDFHPHAPSGQGWQKLLKYPMFLRRPARAQRSLALNTPAHLRGFTMSTIIARSIPLVILALCATTLLPTGAASGTQCGFQAADANGLSKAEIQPTDFSTTNTQPDVAWQVLASSAKDPQDDPAGHVDPARLWYTSTDPTHVNYESGASGNVTNAGSATATTSVPANVTPIVLTFNSRYEIESRDPSTYDQMTVLLSTDGGASFSQLCTLNPSVAYDGTPDQSTCSNGTPNGAYPCPTDPSGQAQSMWEGRSWRLPDSVAGHTIQLRFTFNTVDEQRNNGLGWMFTDVHIGYPAPPPTVPSLGGGGGPPVQGAPTLSEWGYISLAAALGIIGTVMLSGRKPQ